MTTKQITPKIYFDEMREVSLIVKPEILRIISHISNNYPLIKGEYNYYFNKRIKSKKLLLRPFLFKEFLELYRINWKEHISLIALVEIINISTYQSNLAFDSKDGFNALNSKSNQFIASIFSKLRIVDEVVDNSKYSPEQKNLISQIIIKAFERLYYGQYIDINELNFSNISLINDDDIFNKTYIHRCDLLGGSLIEMIANISSVILNKKDDNIINHLFNFAKYFGLAGQIINDLGDFAGNGKSYTLNKLSDLYNEKLTFPLRLAIIKTGNLSKELIVEHLNNPKNLLRIKEETLNFIHPYIKEVNQSLRLLSSENLITNKIDFASKLLTKSEFVI